MDESGKRKSADCSSWIFLVFVLLSFYLKYQEMNISAYWWVMYILTEIAAHYETAVWLIYGIVSTVPDHCGQWLPKVLSGVYKMKFIINCNAVKRHAHCTQTVHRRVFDGVKIFTCKYPIAYIGSMRAISSYSSFRIKNLYCCRTCSLAGLTFKTKIVTR